MSTLESRVALLERENRRLKSARLAFLLVVGAALLMGQASTPQIFDRVRTRRFEVVDDKGNPRILLVANGDSEGITLHDPNGLDRGGLVASSSETAVTLVHLSSGSKVSLSASDGGSLSIRDGNRERLSFLAHRGAPTGLKVQGGTGPMAAELVASDDGAHFSLGAFPDAPRALFYATGTEAGVEVVDREGYSSVLGATQLKGPTPESTMERSAASLVMFDKDKKQVWRAPE